jgi:uncharacterized protein YndB with AHSA1/START domain
MATTASNLSTATTSDREIVLCRTFDAPRELVWRAFTDPARLTNWWGPMGFTTRTHRMEVKPGGAWRFVMVGPDGHEYENLITYLEVKEPERLRYTHGGDKDIEPVNFEVLVTFEKVAGVADRTRVTMRSLFASQKALEFVVREYGAIEGGKQTFERLAWQLRDEAAGEAGPLDRPFVITRVFRAPRALVWDTWTQREHLARWMGPKGTTIARATLELRPGGLFHYGMQTPDGELMWGKWVFREIVPQERLVVVVSFSDEHAGITRHPLAADWPLETLSTMTFAEHAGIGGGTTVVLNWIPVNASDAERRVFAASHAGMEQGWGGTMGQLESYLATIGSGSGS